MSIDTLADLRTLRGRFEGAVYAPGYPGWDEARARRGTSPRISTRPRSSTPRTRIASEHPTYGRRRTRSATDLACLLRVPCCGRAVGQDLARERPYCARDRPCWSP